MPKLLSKIIHKTKSCKTTQKDLLNPISNKVTDEQNYKLTEKIQLSEIKDVIRAMENGKSPGIDGMPIEFYKESLETIISHLQKTFNKTLFDNQKIPKTWN